MPFDTEFDPNEVDAVDDPEVGAAMSNIERLWGQDEAKSPDIDGMRSNAAPDASNIGAPVAAPLRLRLQPKATMPSVKPAQGGAVDWQALKDNLDRASLGARGSRDAEQLFSNVSLGGYHTDPGRFQAQVDDAKRPLELAKAKQDFEGHELDQDAKRQKVGGDTAQLDPNSLQSQKARSAFRAFFQGSTLPPDFDSWSAADVATLGKSAKPLTTYEDQYHKALASQAEELAKERARKGAAEDAASAAGAASLDDERKLLVSKYGFAPEEVGKLDRKGLDHLWDRVGALENKKPTKGPSTPVKAGDYSAVPEDMRETVKAIVEGRAKAPDPGTRFGSQVLNYVTRVDPDFDSTKYGAYKKATEEQATAKDMVAVDVAREHLKTARSLIPKNVDLPWVNRFKQQLASGTGDPEFTRFMVAATVAAHETARAYGVDDQQGKEEMIHLLSSVQSPQQLTSAFDTFEELMAGKQKGRQRQIERLAPKAHTVKVKFPNGRVVEVPRSDLEEAKTKHGGVEVEGG